MLFVGQTDWGADLGYELFYAFDNESKFANDISSRRWEQLRLILPLMIDYVNEMLEHQWYFHDDPGTAIWERDGQSTIIFNLNDGSPDRSPFRIEDFLDDGPELSGNVHFINAREIIRLFAYCDFLTTHAGAFALYQPVVDELKASLPYVAEYIEPRTKIEP